jgi:hypothetical protein
MTLFKNLFKPNKTAVICVGTSIDSFQICGWLSKRRSIYKVMFILNEDPWQHKTQFNGAECRYSSELLALVKNNGVKAILCPDSEKLNNEIKSREEEITKLNCAIIWCDKAEIENSLYEKLQESIK